MAQIYWDQFGWEAFSTLVTGIAAVGGAFIIGFRQSKISSRQSDILERQALLDELKIKGDLFDRRWLIYEATKNFMIEIMRQAAEPEKEIQREFILAIGQAEFLFRPQVKENLEDIWKRSCKFFAVKSVSDHLFATTGDYGQENIESTHAYLIWLNERLDDLGQAFGDELRLSL